MNDKQLTQLQKMAEGYQQILRDCTPYGPQLPADVSRYKSLRDALAHSATDLIAEVYRLRAELDAITSAINTEKL